MKSIHRPEYQQLLTLIRDARIKANLHQSDVANKIGYQQSAYSRIETGERRMDVIEFLLIARALDMNPLTIIKKITLP